YPNDFWAQFLAAFLGGTILAFGLVLSTIEKLPEQHRLAASTAYFSLFCVAMIVIAWLFNQSTRPASPLALPAIKKSQLIFSALRFSAERPDNIDIMLRNTGNTVSVIDKVVFTVHAIHRLVPNEIRTKDLLNSN